MTTLLERNYQLASQLGEGLLSKKLRCAVAESCTGGGLAAAITDISGSSQWFDCGFVTYTNDAKQQLLEVPESVLATYGAVSEQTVCAMAEGALQARGVDITVAISGIAGPTGGSVQKPVGTVWIAWAGHKTHATCFLFKGTRQAVRQQAVEAALSGMIQVLSKDF